MSETLDNLRKRVYYAAKDGMSIALYAMLAAADKTEVTKILNELIVEDDGQECTPLIIAARYGHDKVLRLLLAKFQPDLEKEGIVKIDGLVIEGATPLWCAACAGHLNVVKTLVKAGADVNHPTKAKSTPLRAACFDGRLDIVKYLTYHQADINIANKYNNTCLMIAAYKGHFDVLSFLLEKGVNPDQKALCGATALHFASECGHLIVVKELMKYKAKFLLNESGMTPLKCAAERTRSKVVEYLIENGNISKEEEIEALELLGASYANDKEFYNIPLAYHYLCKAMKLRYNDPLNPIKKKLLKPIAAYENWIESQNLYELQSLYGNNNGLHMEALTIRERILGTDNPEIPHPVIFRGAVFADDGRFDRCLQLWLHALKLRQKSHTSVNKDLLRFAQVFSQMLSMNIKVSYEYIIEVFSSAIVELERNKFKLIKPDSKNDFDVVMEDLESNLTTTLYLLTILTRLMETCSEEEIFNLKRLVFTLNQLRVSTRDGQTLLHLACNSETPVDDFHTNNICRFPCPDTADLLIQCGADVNAMDADHNTPLHIIANFQLQMADFGTLYFIVNILVGAGAHLDFINKRGETPIDVAATGNSIAETVLKSMGDISLKCIAANAIKQHKLTYHGHVPKALESFIELHGPGIVKKA